MTGCRLLMGDCLDVLRTMPDCSVDAVVTDPPYGLAFMGKRWDYDVPSVAIWAECLRVLKPGGHLLAFAGTRTQHRMAVRIEDAGFEIRDMIAWVYGSGFPKSLDVSSERQGVTHPTVKPLDLMAYLCRLVTPPGGVVLDPFMGSGTTIKAALAEGFQGIGIERDPVYFTMAEHRINGAQLGLIL